MPEPGSQGVYSILDSSVSGGDVKRTDTDFAAAYRAACELKRKDGRPAPAPEPSINVAVVDSGVYSAGDAYFGDRVSASGNAQGGLGFAALTRGMPATEGQHGAHVASIASSGTTLIKIIDAQVGSTQEGGSVSVAVWTTALRWSIEQRARIINVSIVCPWSNPSISGIVNGSTGVLFLATSGNANTNFPSTYLADNGLDQGNVMLVGGCARDGKREHNRGFGEGIDVYVPSVNVPGLIAKRYAQDVYYKRDLAERTRQDRRLDPDRETVRSIKEKLALEPDNARLKSQLAREEKRLTSGIDKLPQVPASAAEYPLNEQAQMIADSGVSFAIPMVANVAAKMMLIMPNMTPKQVIAAMRETAMSCEAGRVLDPLACYNKALDERKAWAARL
jgi:hypothetical protein